jgi:hypothetical protein
VPISPPGQKIGKKQKKIASNGPSNVGSKREPAPTVKCTKACKLQQFHV